MESLAVVLRKEREARGVSVYYLSQESGVSEQSIHNYEKGLRHPTLERLARVSKALGLKTSEIIALAESRGR
jgi:transcriptional regulator with XRE-family HTH domain